MAAAARGLLQDPSAAVAASVGYQVSQDTQVALGAFQGVGRKPILAATPELRSEFGAMGGLYYLALFAYF